MLFSGVHGYIFLSNSYWKFLASVRFDNLAVFFISAYLEITEQNSSLPKSLIIIIHTIGPSTVSWRTPDLTYTEFKILHYELGGTIFATMNVSFGFPLGILFLSSQEYLL